jgi:hypothetical protein
MTDERHGAFRGYNRPIDHRYIVVERGQGILNSGGFDALLLQA